jgi:hypothetical protein
MSKPITSRVKRSPLFKYSPLKQDTLATAGGTVEGPDEEIEIDVMGEKTDFVADKDKREKDPEKWEKTRKGICDGSIKGDKSKVNCDDVVVDKKKETVKGEDLDYEGTLQTAKKGRVLEPWEINRLKRGTRKSTNERNQAARRLDKNEGVEFKDGKYVLKDGATAKQRRNFNKQNDRYTQADDQVKNQSLARESGRQAGEEYYKGDRDRGLGEQSDPEQKAQFKRDALKKKKAKEEAARAAKAAKDKAELDAAKKVADEENEQKEADAQGITTGQATNAIGANDIAPISLGGGFGSGLDLYKQSSYTPLAMTKKGYSMKAKSPATKKLQGAQNTLPPHLQAAIKAAPGKMRSALKKGYFKNK